MRAKLKCVYDERHFRQPHIEILLSKFNVKVKPKRRKVQLSSEKNLELKPRLAQAKRLQLAKLCETSNYVKQTRNEPAQTQNETMDSGLIPDMA